MFVCSIMNSLVIVLFLSGMVAMIMLRTLHKDIARYNQMESAVIVRLKLYLARLLIKMSKYMYMCCLSLFGNIWVTYI